MGSRFYLCRQWLVLLDVMYNTSDLRGFQALQEDKSFHSAPVPVHDSPEWRISQKFYCGRSLFCVVLKDVRHDRLHMLPLDQVSIGTKICNFGSKVTVSIRRLRLIISLIKSARVRVETFPLPR